MTLTRCHWDQSNAKPPTMMMNMYAVLHEVLLLISPNTPLSTDSESLEGSIWRHQRSDEAAQGALPRSNLDAVESESILAAQIGCAF